MCTKGPCPFTKKSYFEATASWRSIEGQLVLITPSCFICYDIEEILRLNIVTLVYIEGPKTILEVLKINQ